ncbi:hypothetical protein ASG29_08855 [Sphingomonas sp. Leaf412]|uniref:hypothetical protein n=1 Tax=Sphingomonas sp. Leaf412 TaxID=1736370 RepID=UPI0006F62914|nr:hypothetical protein [Sphingomonas sp. Leaf412]KQT31965.1 hypothetical protein ASG29_08855 [Sphingomonas sp. Leaf412]
MRALALIALAAVAATASSDPRAGRVAGKPATCVSFGQTERLVIADPATLTLRDGRRLWVTQPLARCTPMNVNDILILEPQGAQLCRGDRFRTVQPGTSIPGASCRLGTFVPYDLPKE